MMAKTAYQFDYFHSTVNPDFREFASNIHNDLQADGYKATIESKASGFFVSYSHPKTKRSLLNFFFRKAGLHTRIYGDNIDKYADFLDGIPEDMEKKIAKAPVCKRLINPEDCSSRCVLGYDFSVRSNRYQKCRYSCFQFAVTPESMPHISAFVEHERKERHV